MNLKKTFVYSAVALSMTPLFAGSLTSEPGSFDFGWAPDNARISCDFTVKNNGDNSIALQSLRPACGCTAAQFTPMSLSGAAGTKIGLTFNTRGYKGMPFNKSADLMTDSTEDNIVVHLRGHVGDPDAAIVPVGTGIADFQPSAKKSSEKISLQNKSNTEYTLTIVQPAASWAKVKLDSSKLPAAKQTPAITVSVSGSLNESRETSFTLEAANANEHHRLTIAVRTGPPEKEYEPLRPTNPIQKSGPNDPLKLKGVEPVKSKK